MHIWCQQFPNSSLAVLDILSPELPVSDLCLCFLLIPTEREHAEGEYKVTGQSEWIQ